MKDIRQGLPRYDRVRHHGFRARARERGGKERKGKERRKEKGEREKETYTPTNQPTNKNDEAVLVIKAGHVVFGFGFGLSVFFLNRRMERRIGRRSWHRILGGQAGVTQVPGSVRE